MYVQAERAGLADEFAARYTESDLRVSNEAVLARDMAERQVSPQILKELRTRRATVTPFYWGVKTILKVCRHTPRPDILSQNFFHQHIRQTFRYPQASRSKNCAFSLRKNLGFAAVGALYLTPHRVA